MSFISDLARWRRLTWQRRLLLGETIAALASASVAIRLVPFRRLMASLKEGEATSPPEASADDIARVKWAVEACARRLPWRIVCFQKGLALHRLLGRRGVPTTLHYGVASDSETLKAHVWVSYRGQAIIGGEEAAGYVCLATFPRTTHLSSAGYSYR